MCAGGVLRRVLGFAAIVVGLLGLVYAVYRVQRNRALIQEVFERQQRHREQQEAWDRMLSEMSRRRRDSNRTPDSAKA
jgi:CHASE3 domain sensor protein